MSGAPTLLLSGKGATAPAAPINVSATAVCTKSASVTFSVLDNGGSPITNFTVTSSPGGMIASGLAVPMTVTGLTRGVTYTFTATATNAVGTSTPSAPSNAITAIDAPGAPTVGTLTKQANGSLRVTFTPPADNGGSAITQYRVLFDDETAQFTGATVFAAGSPADSPVAAENSGQIRIGFNYSARVYASNATCESVASAKSNIVTA